MKALIIVVAIVAVVAVTGTTSYPQILPRAIAVKEPQEARPPNKEKLLKLAASGRGVVQDSSLVRDKAQRSNNRLGKALASGGLRKARLLCSLPKGVANERVEEKDLGHNPVGNAKVAENGQVVASVQAAANVKVEESAPPEANAKVSPENVQPADRVKAGVVVVAAAAPPPNRVRGPRSDS